MRTRPVMIEMTANQCSIIDVFQGNGNKSTIKSFFFVVRLFLNQSSSFMYQFNHLERKKDPTMPIIVGLGSVEVGLMMSESHTEIFHIFRDFTFYVFACCSPQTLSFSNIRVCFGISGSRATTLL